MRFNWKRVTSLDDDVFTEYSCTVFLNKETKITYWKGLDGVWKASMTDLETGKRAYIQFKSVDTSDVKALTEYWAEHNESFITS